MFRYLSIELIPELELPSEAPMLWDQFTPPPTVLRVNHLSPLTPLYIITSPPYHPVLQPPISPSPIEYCSPSIPLLDRLPIQGNLTTFQIMPSVATLSQRSIPLSQGSLVNVSKYKSETWNKWQKLRLHMKSVSKGTLKDFSKSPDQRDLREIREDGLINDSMI